MRIGDTPPIPPTEPIHPLGGSARNHLTDALTAIYAAMQKIETDIHSNPPASAATLDADLAAMNNLITEDHGFNDWLNWCTDPSVENPPISGSDYNAITAGITQIQAKMQECVKDAEKSPPDIAGADAAFEVAGDTVTGIFALIWPHSP